MQHHRDDCQCSIIKPNFDGIINAINRGQILVVEVKRGLDSVSLTVSSRSSALPGDYVAISHLWVDGLGSTTKLAYLRARRERRLTWLLV